MINIIDIVVGALILIYLVKNIGGIFKTIKSILIILCALMLFGIIASFVSEWPILGPGRSYLRDSLIVNFSYNMIKIVYPALENSAPKVDSYIKDKILSTPASTKTLPSIPALEKSLPKMTLPPLELPNKKQ